MRCKCFGTGVVLWGNRGRLVLRCKCMHVLDYMKVLYPVIRKNNEEAKNQLEVTHVKQVETSFSQENPIKPVLNMTSISIRLCMVI